MLASCSGKRTRSSMKQDFFSVSTRPLVNFSVRKLRKTQSFCTTSAAQCNTRGVKLFQNIRSTPAVATGIIFYLKLLKLSLSVLHAVVFIELKKQSGQKAQTRPFCLS